MEISILTGKLFKKVKQFAVFDYLSMCNCAVNFDDFDILAAGFNKLKFLLRESLLIKPVKS